MLKFIRGKGQQTSAERQKLQRELFAFRKTVQHGFPNKPSAVAWDPLLRVMAIGTSSGAVKVFGKPGVEFYGQHPNIDVSITELVFLSGTGKLISLCEDNSLHLWEISNESSLIEVKTLALEGKLKKISTLCPESSGNHLLLGTEGGNIYLLDLNSFTIAEPIIYQDVVMQNCQESFKLSPGAVECISEHPTKPHLLLIGYTRGLMVIWDRHNNRTTNTFMSNQQLESVCWHKNGDEFTSSHNDGSYASWELSMREKPFKDPVTLYGPYPCKGIIKLLQRTSISGDDITIFSGGMPRANYSDKYTVTVVQGGKHVVFDFTSKIIDFFTTTSVSTELSEDTVDARPTLPSIILPQSLQQEAAALVVIADEEMVVIDLTDPNWKMMRLPYLVSLHASAVTCSQYISNVDEEIYQNILISGENQTQHLYSSSEWPINGGALLCAKPSNPEAASQRQILLTGHEDGTVRFWDASDVNLVPLYKFTTSNIFSGEDIVEEIVESPTSGDDEEEWPPFRKIGVFDPYSDDPRLAVKKIAFCPLSGVLAVAGTAGHVVAASIGMDTISREVKTVIINIVSDRDGFVWKGHDQLKLRSGAINMAPGFQVSSVVQLLPPAAITCCALQSEWGLLAAGTAHGLALYDYKREISVLQRCTLNPNDLTGAGDTPISRRKSFKKSLRESFRRLRKGRSTRRQTQSSSTPAADAKTSQQVSKKTEEFSPLEAKPVERQIEARPVDDSNGSMVRCLYFARSHLISVQNTFPTLWAGTNNGTVYAFTIVVPTPTKRNEDSVTCQLAKEIQLKHRAPVIGITVLDGASVPLPEPLEVEKGVSPLADVTQSQRVIIASEEQFKIFSLPSLKPYCKYKLTANEGARVRRMAFANFWCTINEGGKSIKHNECSLLCLTNLGDCLVLSVPDLRRQLNAAAVKKEDINGISSLTFSKSGEALYLHSSSELQRITLSANKIVRANGYLSLPPWAQPVETSTAEETTVAPVLNGEHKPDDVNESGTADETQHNVTASSQSIGDITVDSVKDHLIQAVNNKSGDNSPESLASRLGTINLQTSSVNQSSVIIKTTTLTTLNNNSSTGQPAGTTESNTTTASHHSSSTTTENNADKKVLEHSREEGQITRIETSTVTVPTGTDPKIILEMYERSRSPLSAPLARVEDSETETVTITEAH